MEVSDPSHPSSDLSGLPLSGNLGTEGWGEGCSFFPCLPLGLLCFAVGSGAQVQGHGRGAPDYSGPHPGRRWQSLPHWTCKECLSVCVWWGEELGEVLFVIRSWGHLGGASQITSPFGRSPVSCRLGAQTPICSASSVCNTVSCAAPLPSCWVVAASS